jgi:hypothetical protein
MIKGKSYHTMTDSNAREKEAWFADIPDQVAAFRKRGGVVYQAQIGETSQKYTQAFVITRRKNGTGL